MKEPSKTLVIAAFAAIYIIWGSTYIAIVIAIRSIPALLMAGSRFLVAGLILYAWCRIRGQSAPDTRSIGRISYSGILMLCCGTGAVAWVEQYINSGLAAIIVATLPLWFVLLDKHQWKFNFSSKWIISGLLIGFVGVILLFADKNSVSLSGDKMKLISFFVMLAGTLAWAIGSLYSKYKPVQGSTAMKAAIQMIVAGIVLIITGLGIGEYRHLHWELITLESIAALIYLIIMGSLVGYLAYMWLLSVRPPTLVGTYAYVNPIVAVFLGWLIANEKISQQQLIALVVILSGVILVNIAKGK